jgi:hypothetical protein
MQIKLTVASAAIALVIGAGFISSNELYMADSSIDAALHTSELKGTAVEQMSVEQLFAYYGISAAMDDSPSELGYTSASDSSISQAALVNGIGVGW